METTVTPGMVKADMTLQEHEANSIARAARIEKKIKHLKKDDKMTTVPDVNVFGSGLGGMMGNSGVAGAGGAFGGAAAGSILGSLLLNRNGVLGGGVVDGAVGGGVTPALLAASFAGAQDTQMNTAVLQTLGQIQGSIPLAEGQVQLALAGTQSDLTNLINSANVANLQGQFAINKNVSDTTAQIIANDVATQIAVANSTNSINQGIAGLSTQGLQNTYALSQAIATDGEKTRALITSFENANMQRLLTTAQNEIIELRGDQRLDRRSRETEINITNNNTAVAQQQQSQLQNQQQAIVLNNIWQRLDGLQNAVATNSNMIIGNTGATTTGPQTANPVNVRT